MDEDQRPPYSRWEADFIPDHRQFPTRLEWCIRMQPKESRAIVLLSGGLDSATTAALAKSQGFDLYALTFQYGQRHQLETEAAQRVGEALGVKGHKTQTIDLRAFGGSALTAEWDVPKADRVEDMGGGIPTTYVPARNTIFLAFAVAYAEVTEASDIFIGVNAVDYSGYPDCRPAFIHAFQEVAKLGTRAGDGGTTFTIHAPLIDMSKAEIIREAHRLGVDLSLTRSCYDPDAEGRACGHCDSCLLRRRGFADAGLTDPIQYVDE